MMCSHRDRPGIRPEVARDQQVSGVSQPTLQCLSDRSTGRGIEGGIENMPFGRFLSPPLTSVELHADLLGEWAMRNLVATRKRFSAFG